MVVAPGAGRYPPPFRRRRRHPDRLHPRMWRYLGDSRADIQSRRQRNADLGCLLFDTVWWCWPSVPIFPRVPALLGDQLRRIAAIQASTLAGVPHVQPDELGSMADRQFPDRLRA